MARINIGLEKYLYLGNLNAKRDWGHAKDYVEMQWLMLQQEEADDYVISSGRMESVRRFIEIAAKELGWYSEKEQKSIIWEGEKADEIGLRADTKEIVIKIDPRYYRPTEVNQLVGDSSKALIKLGWKPKLSLEDLIKEMIKNDLQDAERESLLLKEGYEINGSMESPPTNTL